eukprot:635417-Pelagomonas_calceolata.AAC.5
MTRSQRQAQKGVGRRRRGDGKAVCGLASFLRVPSRTCMHERPNIQFVPNNAAAVLLMAAVSMQMDKEFKEEQIGILFVWIEALEGGFGGGWWFRPPKNLA